MSIFIYIIYTYVHRHFLIVVDDQSIFNPIMNSRIILKMFTQLLKVSSLPVKNGRIGSVLMFFSQTKLGKFLTWDSDLQVGSCQWKIMKFFPRNLSLWCKKLSKWSWNLVLYDVFGTIN